MATSSQTKEAARRAPLEASGAPLEASAAPLEAVWMCALPIHLVDPERVLHILPDIEAFEAYCDAHNLKKSNMKELLGIFARGREGTAATFK